MSSQKVKKLTRELDYTATWASNVLTLTTGENHYLTTGDKISLRFQDVPQTKNDVTVTVTGAAEFTIPLTDETSVQKIGKVYIDFYGPSQTGTTPAFTIPRGQGSGTAVIQSYVSGTGGAAYTLELSLDGIHWITSQGIGSHGAVDGNTTSMTVDSAWAYGRLNISAIGAATKLYVFVSG